MPRFVIALSIVILFAAGAASAEGPYVRLTTDAGEILLELSPDLAPRHVDNFVHFCRTGFYEGTTFHRVIPGFMIQCGDPNSRDDNRGNDGQGWPTWADVLDPEELAMLDEVRGMLAAKGYAGLDDRAMLKAEFNSTRHVRGMLSMARAQGDDSAGSQFFICVADLPQLDGKYTVFGRVVSGFDTVDAIVSVDRDGRDNPLTPLRLVKTTILDGPEALTEAEREALEPSVTPVVAE